MRQGFFTGEYRSTNPRMLDWLTFFEKMDEPPGRDTVNSLHPPSFPQMVRKKKIRYVQRKNSGKASSRIKAVYIGFQSTDWDYMWKDI